MKFTKQEIVVICLIFFVVGSYDVAANFSFKISQPKAADVNLAQRLSDLQDKRAADWATSYDGWEVLFDGVGTPSGDQKSCALSSAIVPHNQYWDVPFDDDWNDARVVASSFAPNKPNCGLLTVDRASNPLDYAKTGQIFRRDEFLSYSLGTTIETRFHLAANSAADSVSLDLMDRSSFIRVVFSPNNIGFDTGVQGPSTRYPINTTFDHTYRVVRSPNSRTTDLYVDGQLIGSANATIELTNAIKGDFYNFDYPVVSFGDHGYNGNVARGSYVLDFIRYRRGAFTPSQALTAVPPRNPPSLPAPSVGSENFYSGFDGSFIPTIGGTYGLRGTSSSWKLQSGGIVEYNGLKNDTTVVVDPVPALNNKGGYTIEARIKVLPDSQDRGFPVTYMDEVGASSFVLSYGKVETFLGLKPGGFISAPVPSPDDFHIYRLVRKPDDLYTYLYLDNDPVPVIADQHLEASAFLAPYLQFGYLGYPVLSARGHVLIDYIKWHDGAAAPYGPPIPDLTCSNDRGKTFIQGPCADTVAILKWNLVPGATSCQASSDSTSSKFTGSRPTSSTETVEVISSPRIYTITCSGTGGSSSDSVTINIPAATSTPTPFVSVLDITPLDSLTVKANQAFSVRLHPTGGTPPYKWAATNPPYWTDNGIYLHTHYKQIQTELDGEMLGTPTKAGTYSLQIQLWDQAGHLLNKKINLIVQ